MRFAIVLSRFNPEVTQGLLAGARTFLEGRGLKQAESDIIEAPGAFELPLIAQQLAKTGKYDGVICLGCVIKGDTAHFEFISLGAAIGIQQAALETGVPIAFGVLTTYNDEQARVRSLANPENKGREAAQACVEAAETLRKLSLSRNRSRKTVGKLKQKRKR